MARFGGNEFTTFSVPLAFEGRYFILEPGDPPRVSVVREYEGAPVFEVMRNEPVDNPLSEVTKTAAGVVTVSDKTGKFLYKVRPHYETSVVFGKMDGGEVSARVTDRNIQVGGITLENNVFSGAMESYLVSRVEQAVEVHEVNQRFHFDAFEPIHTEYSYKFLESDIAKLADDTGFVIEKQYYDDREYFVDSLWRVEKVVGI